jgi:tryptophanyl-tRNA synthetase
MARILTGIQSTGTPHLGNILGALQPAIELSNNPNNEAFLFIADFHSLTSIKDGKTIKENTLAVAAAWLAFGFDTDKNVFYRQSDVPEVTELAWYLNCFTPLPMLENAHSYKDKTSKMERNQINTGLFTYPVLMAADILLYDAEVVPVGKDQKQHLEITRDIAGSINHQYGDVFVVPEAKINEQLMVIPGIDGRKMSKSYNNYINIFLDDKKLRKNVMKIETDSTPLEDPKNPDTCNVFQLYSLLASEGELLDMKENYLKGGYGYGHAKQALFEKIAETYQTEREAYTEYINNPETVYQKLKEGGEKAREVANATLGRLKRNLGY